MRELLLIGFVSIAFGLGSNRAIGEMSAYSAANLVAGAGSLLVAGALAIRRWERLREGSSRSSLVEPALMLISLIWGVTLVERFAAQSALRFDWTFESRYELASATQMALQALPGPLRVTLYQDELDPRARRTRLLLEELTRFGDVEVRQRLLSESVEDEDRFGIRSSNSVVLELGPRWERVDRPTEGSLFEAISYIGVTQPRIIYATTGAGEGDLASTAPLGYSGLAAAFETEGCQLRQLVTATVREVPADADAVLVIAPERNLRPEALDALRSYLESGGSLIALLEPQRESGLEKLLEEFGLSSPNAVVIDPTAGSIDGAAPGLNPIAFNYSEHPITQGLNRNRRTFFRGARSFRLRKPRPDDELRALVYSSRESWLFEDPNALSRRIPIERPADAVTDYQPLVVAGRYQRKGGEARVVVFGDRDFATNRDLRALYNLDLVMNALQWVIRRESKISLRPKSGQLIQFPVPIQNSLRALYGVGLLVPELLLLTGGLVWLRRRSS